MERETGNRKQETRKKRRNKKRNQKRERRKETGDERKHSMSFLGVFSFSLLRNKGKPNPKERR
jgi:hypothetical protein